MESLLQARCECEAKAAGPAPAALSPWLHLMRAARARQALVAEFGWALRVARSGIDNAGSGLFVVGTAPAGALLALYPGFVHEHSSGADPPEGIAGSDASYWVPFAAAGEAGGFVDGTPAILDRFFPGRKESPVWVANMANHPSPPSRPNTQFVDVHVSDAVWAQMPLTEPALLMASGGGLVPGRPGTVVALRSTRELREDEEVFVDYRLDRQHAPSWYCEVGPETIGLSG